MKKQTALTRSYLTCWPVLTSRPQMAVTKPGKYGANSSSYFWAYRATLSHTWDLTCSSRPASSSSFSGASSKSTQSVNSHSKPGKYCQFLRVCSDFKNEQQSAVTLKWATVNICGKSACNKEAVTEVRLNQVLHVYKFINISVATKCF